MPVCFGTRLGSSNTVVPVATQMSSPPVCNRTSFNRGGNRGVFRLPGAGRGSFPLYGGTFARSFSVSKKIPQNSHQMTLPKIHQKSPDELLSETGRIRFWRARFRTPSSVHRVLQGAPQRGAQFDFIFAVLRTLFSCSKMSLFHLKTCCKPP